MSLRYCIKDSVLVGGRGDTKNLRHELFGVAPVLPVLRISRIIRVVEPLLDPRRRLDRYIQVLRGHLLQVLWQQIEQFLR